MRPECPVQDQVSTTTTWSPRARWLHDQSPPAPAVVTNTYERPIPTPIDNLRPARDTCEQCHWPAHFSGDKQQVNTYFKSEEDNTRWTIALLRKVIAKDCNSCHTILYQGTDPTPTTLAVTGLKFEHPAEVGEVWKEMNCKDSHAGQ